VTARCTQGWRLDVPRYRGLAEDRASLTAACSCAFAVRLTRA
jgi:hypothetical protein